MKMNEKIFLNKFSEIHTLNNFIHSLFFFFIIIMELEKRKTNKIKKKQWVYIATWCSKEKSKREDFHF